MHSQVKRNNAKIGPLVSVIVPSYNHERYIKECIENIINQTYKKFELIVIDDGSKDNSIVILNDLKSKYNFTLVFQENHGVSYTLNRGIKEFSSGKYITFCASDDYWSLDKIEKQVNFMEANQFYPMCYGKNYYIDESSNILEGHNVNNRLLKGGYIFNEIFLFKIHPPVNYMYQAAIFNEVGNYKEGIFAEDYFMNLQITSKYCIGFINDYLGYYRLTDQNLKVIRYDKVNNSHLMAIELFKHHHLYKKARLMVYLRKYVGFSGFTDYKIKALKYLFKSFPLCLNKIFLVATFNLFFKWKR